MFAKRQSALAAAAGQAPGSGASGPGFGPLIRFLKRPMVAVGAAGLLTLGAAALFLVVLGDPRAGMPSARVALSREAPPPAEAAS
ncbi:MAG: divergent polysaccharide deacetylase family protein, partial [Brevundimonas sp.]